MDGPTRVVLSRRMKDYNWVLTIIVKETTGQKRIDQVGDKAYVPWRLRLSSAFVGYARAVVVMRIKKGTSCCGVSGHVWQGWRST